MRRMDFEIPVGLQSLTRVTKLCVRECVSNCRGFDKRFRLQKHLRTQN